MKNQPKADLSSRRKVTALPTTGTFPLTLRFPQHSDDTVERILSFDFVDTTGEFGRRVVEEFLLFSDGKTWDTVAGEYLSIRLAFRYILSRKILPWNELAHHPKSQWKEAVRAWADDMKAFANILDVTTNSHISNVNRFLRRLIKAGLVPDFSLPGPVPNAKFKRELSLAEVVPDFDAAEIVLRNATDRERAVWSRLAELTDVSDPRVMIERNDILLNEVRRHAETAMREVWAKFTEGQELLKTAKLDLSAYAAAYETIRAGKVVRRQGWSAPLRDTGNLLKYIEERFNGIFPHVDEDKEFCRFVYSRGRLWNKVRGRLHVDIDEIVPFLVPILIDTAMNVSCAMNLRVDALTKLTKTEALIEWVKPRAGYISLSMAVPIGSIESLQSNSTSSIAATQAFQCLQKMTERLRKAAGIKNSMHLCLTVGNKSKKSKIRVRNLAAHSLAKAWQYFRADRGLLRLFPFTLRNIRQSLLLREFLVSGGDIFKVKELAGHKNIASALSYTSGIASTTVNSGPPREVHDFILIGATRREDIREGLGIDANRAEYIVEQAKDKSGFLGYRTSDEDDSLDKVSHLVKWILGGEHQLLKSAGLAAEIVAFRDHLVREVPLLKTSPEYETTWGPLLVFLHIAVDRMPSELRVEASKLARDFDLSYVEIF